MANPFSKGWKYLMSSLDQKIDENADPKVQIQQAIDGAKKQHQEITEQAAEIIGNKNQLSIKIDRVSKMQQEYQDQARRALEMADQASTNGDAQKAQEYNDAAEVVASQLVSAEQELEDLKQQYASAEQAADQAQQQQRQSEARLKEQLAEVNQLRAQADQAAMQEKSTEALSSMNDLAPDDDVPTLDSVREKIERRYANALGAQELAPSAGASRMEEITSSGNDYRASARLDEIRSSMGESKKQIEGGEDLNDEV